MPIVVRPSPPPPMSVTIAAAVFGSEALIALIRYYQLNPGGTQREAREALDLPRSLVAAHVQQLVEVGVLLRTVKGSGPRPDRYKVDQQRVAGLLAALKEYALAVEG